MTVGGMLFMDEKADRPIQKFFISDSPIIIEYFPDQTLVKICADLKIKSLEQN